MFAEYTNYFMLYLQYNFWKEKYTSQVPNSRELGRDDAHLPPIFTDIVGDDGNIMYRYEFREIMLTALDGLVHSRKDNNLSAQHFKMRFAFNDLKIDFRLNDIKANGLNKDRQHDFDGNNTLGHNQ